MMLARGLPLTALALIGVSTLSDAHAQERKDDCDGQTDVLVSPRVGITSDDFRGHDEVATGSPTIVQYGLTVVGRVPCDVAQGIPFVQAGNYALALTGGASDENGVHSERLSGEVFIVAPTNEYFGFAAGYRYERALDERTTPVALGMVRAETELHSVRIGVAGTLPLFQTNKSRLFSALYVAGGVEITRTEDALGVELGDDEFFAGPEVIVGYAVDISKDLVFDVRYRTALYATDFSGASEAQAQNGVFFSLGYKF